jgi:hypothetical protein
MGGPVSCLVGFFSTSRHCSSADNHVELDSAVLNKEIGVDTIMEKREFPNAFHALFYTVLALMLSYQKMKFCRLES